MVLARSSLSTRVARAPARTAGSQRGIDEVRRDTLYAPSNDPSGPPPLPPSSPVYPLHHPSAFRWHPPRLRTLARCQLALAPFADVACLAGGMGVRGSVVLLIARNHASYPRDATPTFAFPPGNSRDAPRMQPPPRSPSRDAVMKFTPDNSTGSNPTHPRAMLKDRLFSPVTSILDRILLDLSSLDL